MTSERIDVGIDPGKTGALAAIYHHTGELIDVDDMPVIGKHVSAPAVSDILRRYAAHGRLVVAIEDVHSMPGNGHAGAFSFGRSKGVVEACVATLGHQVHLVTPAKWKRDMGLRSDKDAARQLATNTWPTRAELFALKKHDGRAEAALLAGWCRANVGRVAA